jgi:hypothetical protein
MKKNSVREVAPSRREKTRAHLNERIKRLPTTRPLEILFGLEHDLISPGSERREREEEV